MSMPKIWRQEIEEFLFVQGMSTADIEEATGKLIMDDDALAIALDKRRARWEHLYDKSEGFLVSVRLPYLYSRGMNSADLKLFPKAAFVNHMDACTFARKAYRQKLCKIIADELEKLRELEQNGGL